MVRWSKSIHLRRKAASLFFWPLVVKRKDGGPSLSRNCSGTTSHPQFWMSILRNDVSSRKLFHLGQKGASERSWPVLVKRKGGDCSLSRNCVETSSLAQFCMRILEMWLVLEHSSTCAKKEPPRVSGLFWSKGRMESILCPGTAWKLPRLPSFA